MTAPPTTPIPDKVAAPVPEVGRVPRLGWRILAARGVLLWERLVPLAWPLPSLVVLLAAL